LRKNFQERLFIILKKVKIFFIQFQNPSSITNTRWNAEEQLFILLYSLIKANNSKLIIETGVANSITTNAIMKSLEESRAGGELHSFDVLPETTKLT
jgi:hypothetical protein